MARSVLGAGAGASQGSAAPGDSCTGAWEEPWRAAGAAGVGARAAPGVGSL